MSDFPMMLYKSGSEIEWDGAKFNTIVVEDADALTVASDAGWLTAGDVAAALAAPAGEEAAAPRGRRPKAD